MNLPYSPSNTSRHRIQPPRFVSWIRAVLERGLDEAAQELVGARRYERLATRRDNLSTHLRRILTSMGEVAVEMPRTRENFSPTEVVGRYKRRVSEVDAMITEAYVQDSSTRDVSRLTETLIGQKSRGPP